MSKSSRCGRFNFVLLLLFASCTHGNTLKPDLSLVTPYSYELEEKEPFNDRPFTSIFEKEGRHLTYVAAHHESQANNPTYKLISKAIAEQQPKIIVLEGFKTSLGVSPKDLLKSYRESSTKTFYKWGEPAYTALQADSAGIKVVGGEPDDVVILEAVQREGYTTNDLLGFYFVRQVPQFMLDGSISKSSIKSLFDDYMMAAKQSLNLADNHAYSYIDFVRWYEVKNKKMFTPQNFDIQEIAPLPYGNLATQRLSHSVGMVRDMYVVNLLANLLNAHENVMIVFGRSHLPTQRKALESMLGTAKRQETIE